MTDKEYEGILSKINNVTGCSREEAEEVYKVVSMGIAI